MRPIKRVKTLNSEILTKTEIALQVIKKQNEKPILYNQKRTKDYRLDDVLMDKIDGDYSRLHTHKQMHNNKTIQIQLFAFSQQYYFIDLTYVIFPVRLFIKNMHNQGIMYVGYDREYPGVRRRSSNKFTQDEEQQKIYDYKYTLNKEMMISLKKQPKKQYLAKKEILMFSFKFDFVGYNGMQEDEPQLNRFKRIHTETSLTKGVEGFKISQPLITPNSYNNRLPEIDSLQKQHRRNSSIGRKTSKLDWVDRKPTKDHLIKNLNEVKKYRRSNTQSLRQLKHEKSMEQEQRIKVNRENVIERKQKQRQVKQTSASVKKLIESYQENYKLQVIKKKKIILQIPPLLLAVIFVAKSNKIYNKGARSMESAFTIRYFIRKFTTKMIKNNQTAAKMQPYRKHRNQASCLHFVQFATKSLQFVSTKKAVCVIMDSLTEMLPGLMLNHALNRAVRYRRAVRNVQKRWIVKYRARLSMLLNFSERHVQTMLSEYPHLKMGYQTYKKNNQCQIVSYDYMADESIKFRYIYDAYRKRVQQIQEFRQQNAKIAQYNKNKSDKKKKDLLIIPNNPYPPQHRVFRNLDILKSMLRGWFQMEYKKILKKNSSWK